MVPICGQNGEFQDISAQNVTLGKRAVSVA